MRRWIRRAATVLLAFAVTWTAFVASATADREQRQLTSKQTIELVHGILPAFADVSGKRFHEALGVLALNQAMSQDPDVDILYDGKLTSAGPRTGPDFLAFNRSTGCLIVGEAKGTSGRAAALTLSKLRATMSGFGRTLVQPTWAWLRAGARRYLEPLERTFPVAAQRLRSVLFDNACYDVVVVGVHPSDGHAFRRGDDNIEPTIRMGGGNLGTVSLIAIEFPLTSKQLTKLAKVGAAKAPARAGTMLHSRGRQAGGSGAASPGQAGGQSAMADPVGATRQAVGVAAAPGGSQEPGAGAPTGTNGAASPVMGIEGMTSSTGSALDPELGGVDFSTLELRYVSDVSSDKTRAAGFAFRARPSRAGSDAKRGRNAAQRASDAFFVWLALPTSAMWVNLNPSEPDRIIEPRFGRTSAGRVLLEADLRMKKTAARLTNPNTRTGRRYWNELDAITGGEVACSSARMWIVPAPATVRETADELYIVKAPLKVKLESDLLGALGSSCGLPVYAKEIEAVSRRLILPRVQRAVRSAPEYAALRSVYMSRVAAEWYRKRADREHGAFAEIVDSGDISRWAPKRSWTPRQTFRRYVRSYENGEYKVKRRTRKGNIIYTYTYTSGGVDFADVPRRNVSPRELLRLRPGLPSRISRALTRPTADPQTGDVWLAGASFDRAAAAKDPVFTGEQAGGGLARPILLLVLCVVILAAAAWSIVRWRTSPARHSRG